MSIALIYFCNRFHGVNTSKSLIRQCASNVFVCKCIHKSSHHHMLPFISSILLKIILEPQWKEVHLRNSQQSCLGMSAPMGKWRKPSLMEQAAEDVVTPACSAKVESGLFLPRTDSGSVLPPTPKTNKETKKKQLM